MVGSVHTTSLTSVVCGVMHVHNLANMNIRHGVAKEIDAKQFQQQNGH